MGFFSSKQKGKSESRQRLWEPAAPGMTAAARKVGEYAQLGMTPEEQAAQESLRAGAEAYPGMLEGLMQPGMQALTGALGAPQAALGMGLTDILNNPAVQAQAGAIQTRLSRNLAENILPGIRGGAATLGTLGSTRQGIGEALAGRGTQEALGSALADLYGGAYQAGLGAETARYGAGLGAASSAMGMLPGMAELGLSQYTQPAALQQAAGQIGMAPYQRAMTGMGALQGPAAAFGERISRTESKSSPSAFSSLGNILSAAGGLGGAMGLGGGAGLLSGLFTGGEAMNGGFGTMGAGPWGIAGDRWGYGGGWA